MKDPQQREQLTSEAESEAKIIHLEPFWMRDIRAAQARIEAQRQAMHPGSEPERRPEPPDQAA